MVVPKYYEFFEPILKLYADGREYRLVETTEILTNTMNFSKEDKQETTLSGDSMIKNRISWARTYLKKAGLIESKKRGFTNITQRGLDAINSGFKVDLVYLSQFDEFQKFNNKKHSKKEIKTLNLDNTQSIITQIKEAKDKLDKILRTNLVACINQADLELLEEVIGDLIYLIGLVEDPDDTITIKHVENGFDKIFEETYVESPKNLVRFVKTPNIISFHEVFLFKKDILSEGAIKGIFITSSKFSDDARDFADNVDIELILFDIEDLVELMMEFNIGLSSSFIEIKELNKEYFGDNIDFNKDYSSIIPNKDSYYLNTSEYSSDRENF